MFHAWSMLQAWNILELDPGLEHVPGVEHDAKNIKSQNSRLGLQSYQIEDLDLHFRCQDLDLFK